MSIQDAALNISLSSLRDNYFVPLSQSYSPDSRSKSEIKRTHYAKDGDSSLSYRNAY